MDSTLFAKNSLFVLLSLLCFSANALEFREQDLGAGVMLGEPLTLTAKKFIDDDKAVDFGIGFGFSSFLSFHGDYLWHWGNLFAQPTDFAKDLSLYLGTGFIFMIAQAEAQTARRSFTDNGQADIAFCFRMPFGVEWKPKDPPIGVFVELAPAMGITPASFIILHGGVGIRYFM